MIDDNTMELTRKIALGVAGTIVLFAFALTHSAYAQSYGQSHGGSASSSGSENSGYEGSFSASLNGGNEVPSVNSSTTGSYSSTLYNDEIDYLLTVNNGDDITLAHLHCGASGEKGPAVVTLYSSSGIDVNATLASGVISNNHIQSADCASVVGYNIANVNDLAQASEDGDIYVNVHSLQYPNGLIRGQLSGTFSESHNGNDEKHKDDRNDKHAGHQAHSYDKGDHHNDGYWDKNGAWHHGMDGKSDSGYWGGDHFWHENGQKNSGNKKDDHKNDWDWKHSGNDWDEGQRDDGRKQDQDRSHSDSHWGSNHDKKEAHNAKNDNNDRKGEAGSRWNLGSSASANVQSFIRANSNINIRVR